MRLNLTDWLIKGMVLARASDGAPIFRSQPMNRAFVPFVAFAFLVIFSAPCEQVMAQTSAAIDQEISGIESAFPLLPTEIEPHGATIPPGGLLLIPESTTDRVMAFDPATGDLINADYIPADPDNLSTPIHAILKSDGSGFLVSDQLDDVVQEYDLSGAYVGIFAPAGGLDNSILDNIRGMEMRPNGNLLVTVGGGANASSVAEFDTSGAYLGNFVAIGAGGLDSPFDALFRGTDYLVGGISSDQIHSYDLAGAANPSLTAIDTFPEQIALAANGNVLVANFSGTEEGIVEYTSAGALVGVYDPPSLGGYRGVYELPNGNILTTNGGGVHEIDRAGNLVETKFAGVSARFITLVSGGAPFVEPAELPAGGRWSTWLLGLILAAVAMRFLVASRSGRWLHDIY
jgi:hypothetical protein